MKLSPIQLKTLKYLLRDVASKAELDHQFTDGHAADELVKLGLIVTHAGFYSITNSGRKVTTLDRNEAAAAKQLKPMPVYVPKKLETISFNQPLNIADLSRPQSSVFNAAIESTPTKRGNTMNAVVEKRSTNAVQIKYSPRDLVDVVVLRNQINKINLYDEISIDNSHLRGRMSRDLYNFKRANILIEDADGLIRVGDKCNAYLAKQADKKVSSEVIKFPKPSADFKLLDTAELVHKVKTDNAPAIETVEKTPDDQFDIPAFLRKDKSSLPSQLETIHATSGQVKVGEIPAESFQYELPDTTTNSFEAARLETKRDIEKLMNRVRFAYTDEHTILIMEHGKEPLELSADDTKRLLDFANEISMVAVV